MGIGHDLQEIYKVSGARNYAMTVTPGGLFPSRLECLQMSLPHRLF